MMDENSMSLDQEFKRYLQIMRPYLGQLADQDVIDICNSWIQRLSNCCEKEKPLRNKYVFVLCYQLAKGILDEPFLKTPSKEELPSISEGFDSDSSTELEYLVIDEEETKTKVIYNNRKPIVSDTEYLSQDNEFDSDKRVESSREFDSKNHMTSCDEKEILPSHQQTILCYTCPQISTYTGEGFDGEYEYRANNLIMKLREIKKQNVLLHNELMALKEESQTKAVDETVEERLIKVDNSTSVYKRTDSITTLTSLKTKLQEVQETNNSLTATVFHLQKQLDQFNDIKKHEIEEIEAKHKMELVKIKSALRGESKDMYEKKLEELKQYYEKTISDIQKHYKAEIEKIKKEKEDIAHEMANVVTKKDAEIATLKSQLEDKNTNLHSILNKFLEKSNEDTSDSTKLKTQELEKRLNKMEKSKIKNARLYESKLAYLQREKHLAECSLQLQLVRQRAQVVNEIAEENQSELNTALEKLETRYKDIVANVQATAIQRRMQDQITLDAILQAACGHQDVSCFTNHNQFSGKTVTPNVRNQKDGNHSYESEVSGLQRNKVGNVGSKSFGEDSVVNGFCLDGERLNELFEKVYIPQRDTGDGPLLKQ